MKNVNSVFFIMLLFLEPMRTPKTLKIAEIQARHIAVDWESLGYNITRCHTFNVTICYHYFCGHNESKADCLDMDPKAPQHVVDRLPPYTNVSLKMILTNPEGRKESEETIIQTDEDGMLNVLKEITSKSSLGRWKEMTLCVTICIAKGESSLLLMY